MIATRSKEQKQQTFSRWKTLPNDLQFHVALFFVLDDGISFQRASKAALALMNEVWKLQFEPQFKKHFSFDISRLQRTNKGDTNFLSEYKKCETRDYFKHNHYRFRNPRGRPLPPLTIQLLTLFKEGKLEEIKKLNPPLTLEALFSVRDYQGRCIIQWARNNGHQGILDYFYKEALKQYHEDSSINHSTGFLNAPRLYWAACFNQVDALGKFLEAKEINVHAQTQSSETALHIASFMGNSIIADKLLSAKAEVDVQNHTGETPCHLAAYTGNRDVVTLLISYRADVNSSTQNHTYSWLHWDGSGNTPLMRASQRGNYEVASVLVNAGAQVNSKTDAGKTALWWAVEKGQQEMVPLLLDAKSEVNVVDKTSIGDSLIHVAADCNDMFSVRLLIEKKADVNVIENQGYSALASIAWRGHTQMVRTLLDAGAKWPYDHSNSRRFNRDWPLTYIFDQHTEVKPDIKKMLVIAEIDQQLSKMLPSVSTLLASMFGLFSVKYTEALHQLKSAVESDASLEIFQIIKQSYPKVFAVKEYNDIYNRACSIVNPASADCQFQCSAYQNKLRLMQREEESLVSSNMIKHFNLTPFSLKDEF